MQGSVIDHVCKIGASSLWVIEEHGRQALILRVKPTGDKYASICGSDSVATKRLMYGMDKAEKSEKKEQSITTCSFWF